jgi:hypothetical protein
VLAFSTQVYRSPWIFKGEKILSTPSFRGEVRPSVPCRRFAACKRSLDVTTSAFRQNYWIQFLPIKFHLSLLGSLALHRTWRHLAATVGTSKTRGEQGSTTSLKAAVQPGHWLRALIYSNFTYILTKCEIVLSEFDIQRTVHCGIFLQLKPTSGTISQISKFHPDRN